MGLDMYLTGEKYLPTNWDKPEDNVTEDGFRLKSKELQLGYWRKHPNLHGYIVNTFAGGNDNPCQRIELSANSMRQIIEAVKNKDLPHTEGFFFGESDGSEDEETIEIFTKAIAWLETKEDNVWRSVFYTASW